jgi:carbamoyltransferase
MLILGWHGSPFLREADDSPDYRYHDGAAVLLRDGDVVAAIEEERLNRVKHSNFFPARAIRHCLAAGRATISGVDWIVTDWAEDFHEYLALRDLTHDARTARRTVRQTIAAMFQREFRVDVSDKLLFCKHHLAHLFGAWYPSGFSEALVACLDGDGDGSSGLIAHCRGDQFKILRNLPEACSLGNFYTSSLGFLGYQRFDEYKVMGLAPYGDRSAYQRLFGQMYRLQPEGRFSVASEPERLTLLKEAGLAPKFRRKGEPITQDHKDFASALQGTLERIATHVLTYFRESTGIRRLCLSGGVAHNCTMNGLLLRSGLFDEVYVQPAAHDAGNASVPSHHAQPRAKLKNVLPHLFLGMTLGRRMRSSASSIDGNPH